MAITKQSPTQVVPTSRRSTRWLPVIWFTLFTLLGGAFLWHAFRNDPITTPANATLASAAAQPQPQSKYVTQAIRDIQVGTWVLADNPELEDEEAESDFGDVVPAEWRRISLTMTKEDGSRLDIELLRPMWWLEENGADPIGSTIELDLDELGAAGPAQVLSIHKCPEIQPCPSQRHRIVTGKFAHSATEVIRLSLAGLKDSIGVTSNHPFWSVDRHEFVPAGQLQVNERLLNVNGGESYVHSLVSHSTTETIYNLEVDGEHVYCVSHLGVIVHNACSVSSLRKKAVREAWQQERELVRLGGGTRQWTNTQKKELLKTGKVKGFQGHHTNRVNGHVQHAGNPNNIRFVTRAGNLAAHGENFRNPTSGALIDRAKMIRDLMP